MSQAFIPNFVDNFPIEIGTRPALDNLPAVVSIYQQHGALSFQHSMRTDQARMMAMHLLDMADELEGKPDAFIEIPPEVA